MAKGDKVYKKYRHLNGYNDESKGDNNYFDISEDVNVSRVKRVMALIPFSQLDNYYNEGYKSWFTKPRVGGFNLDRKHDYFKDNKEPIKGKIFKDEEN